MSEEIVVEEAPAGRMTPSIFDSKYFEALGLDPNSKEKEDKKKIENALKRAHELRKFEIENYWKRATYFWAFQAVAFAALGLLFREGRIGNIELIALPAGLGTLTALAGWLTAKGSKFWQENWEAHVDKLESAVEGRLTQVIVFRGEPQFSVSRTNERLLLILWIGWGLALVATTVPPVTAAISTFAASWHGAIVLAIVLVAGLMLFRTRTRLSGRRFDVNTDSWAEHPNAPKSSYSIIWRDPLGGRPSP